MDEETLAAKYAKQIKAVAEVRDEEIETLYREYQEECKSLKTTEAQDGRISRTCPDSESPILPSPCQPN